jgi:hypothetical protein
MTDNWMCPGGCDSCDALLLVQRLGEDEFVVDVWHDEDCPTQPGSTARMAPEGGS